MLECSVEVEKHKRNIQVLNMFNQYVHYHMWNRHEAVSEFRQSKGTYLDFQKTLKKINFICPMLENVADSVNEEIRIKWISFCLKTVKDITCSGTTDTWYAP